jgi:cysteinyl-tRNA synthetase
MGESRGTVAPAAPLSIGPDTRSARHFPRDPVLISRMTLRVYNTLSKNKELFEPFRPGKVGMYLCGPTVYKSPHIGHMVGPVVFDAVKRYLQYKGYEVHWVVNITDVDDKLINAAAKAGLTMKDMAEKHAAEYFECLTTLGIDTVDRFPKASEHITDIVELCDKLVATGTAYAADGNVWFDVTKDSDYGKLSNRKVADQEAGNRTLEGSGKKNAADFALWKAAKPGEPAWDSPWGRGRPGWHIECSAMAMKYLGNTFDIHGGGMDLMFPHHENELAQSESATGQPFARFWMHNGLTKVRTKAASGEWKTDDIHETTGNAAGVRAKQLLETHGPDLLRYLLLSTQYRRPIEFTDEAIANCKKALSVFTRLFERIERLTGKPVTSNSPDAEAMAAPLLDSEMGGVFIRDVLNLKIKFMEMMDDDFNTAGAVAVLHELAGEVNGFIERQDLERAAHDELASAAAASAGTLLRLANLLGIFRKPAASAASAAASKNDGLVDGLMALLIKLRADARLNKNFALADQVRDGLIKAGVTLEDRADGTTWRKTE